jgi:hypothetical protein
MNWDRSDRRISICGAAADWCDGCRPTRNGATDSLKWTAAPPVLPKGAQIAVLYGDPDKAEPFVFRLKFPAGYKVAAHMHPNDCD